MTCATNKKPNVPNISIALHNLQRSFTSWFYLTHSTSIRWGKHSCSGPLQDSLNDFPKDTQIIRDRSRTRIEVSHSYLNYISLHLKFHAFYLLFYT
jgi:hypothetical protein